MPLSASNLATEAGGHGRVDWDHWFEEVRLIFTASALTFVIFVSINAVEQHTNIFSGLGELLRRVVAYVPISELEKYLPDVRPRPRKRRSMRRRRSPVRMPPGHWLYEEDWLVPFPDARQADGRIELLIDGNGEVGLARL